MTLFQFQVYLEEIGEIVKLFQGNQTGKEAPTPPGAGGGEISTAEKRRLIDMAKAKGIKLPTKI